MVEKMRNFGTFLLTMVAAGLLASCGGSSSSTFATSGTSASSGNTGGATAITLTASSPQLLSDGSKGVTITAIVKNAANAIVSNVPVTFAASSGAIAPIATQSSVAAGTTDANGEAEGTLTTPGDPTNRSITVTATVGTASSTLTVQVIGTKLTISGPTSLVKGSFGTFNVSLADSAGNGIAGRAVTVASSNSNTLSSTSLTTDASGHVTFQLTAVNAGNDNVTATALGLTATQTVSVSGQSFNFSAPAANTVVALNTTQAITLVWANNGAPVTGTSVTFSTTRGLFTGNVSTTSATTDGTGTATVSVSSATAGPASITASASGASATLAITFVATNPTQIAVQPSPATIPTSGQSTITAIVRDPQNNLVAGRTVDFQLTDLTGGTISVATAVTDSQGRAQTVYTATSTASAANGVQVTATVEGTSPAVQSSATLTVGGQTVFLSLGTGSIVSENSNKTQFSLPYVIQALDSGGNAVPGVAITVTIHSFPQADVPTLALDGSTTASYFAYGKGYWVTAGSAAAGAGNSNCTILGSAWCQVVNVQCYNEDTDGSGVLRSSSQDINGNGKLDPGDVAAVSPGSITTDSTGTANINVTYPEDHAGWVHVLLTATAMVSGTQSSTSTNFVLPILASYVNNANATPPGSRSPYGVASVCTDPN
jgi:hypothetical protein